jgi:hypothetical protein
MTAKRSRESRRRSRSKSREPLTKDQITELQRQYENETGVSKSEKSRPSSLPKVKQAWGGKRKTSKRRRAKKSCGWFW